MGKAPEETFTEPFTKVAAHVPKRTHRVKKTSKELIVTGRPNMQWKILGVSLVLNAWIGIKEISYNISNLFMSPSALALPANRFSTRLCYENQLESVVDFC